jgi:ACS family hexuronate transporter-like MFS transporter
MGTQADPASGSSSSLKWWICGLLLLATTLNYMDRQALTQTGPEILADFRINEEDYSKFGVYFNIGFGIGALLFGYLVDKINLRYMYAGLVVAWSTVGFFTGFTTGFTGLLVCRLLLGIFEAGNWPCGIMTVKRVLKPEERSLGNGMFQSGTALGAILIPLVVLAVFSLSDPNDPKVWQLPFRIIGVVGIVWVGAWLWIVKDRHVAPLPPTPEEARRDSYWALWTDRRFYVMIVVIVGVNMPWRTLGEWMQLFLRKTKGYTREEAQWFATGYYLVADAGSIVAGLITLRLARGGHSLYFSRMASLGICAALSACLLFAPFVPPRHWLLIPVLFLVAFGTLGAFSTYFAFSQEISAKHQGKVTGTLGLINSACMAGLVWIQGKLVKQSGNYDLAFGMTALAPLVAMLAIALFWNSRSRTATGVRGE